MLQEQTQSRETEDLPFGLTLSGGGFRATLFHLGVVRYLFERGLLHEVTHICSVSGGSILAAHLVLNWDRYLASETSFNEMSQELIAFTQCGVRGRLMRRWLFSLLALGIPRIFGKFGRTDLLEKEYRQLFGDSDLRSLCDSPKLDEEAAQRSRRIPKLHILAASMTNGQSVSFGPVTFHMRDDERDEDPLFVDDLQIAFAVTASSAFPPAFPPVLIGPKHLNLTSSDFKERFLTGCHHLTDGGVFDNLGIRKLKWIEDEQNIRFKRIVISDAQRQFKRDVETSYKFIIKRASRSTDLLMNRNSWFENELFNQEEKDGRCRVLRCGLKQRIDLMADYILESGRQSSVHQTRTDLDGFSDIEVNSLVQHGYAVARINDKDIRLLDGAVGPLCSEPWRPIETKATARTPNRPVWRQIVQFVDVRDAYSWMLVVILGVYIAGIAGIISYRSKQKNDQDLTLTTLRLNNALASLASHRDFETADSKKELQNWYKIKDDAKNSGSFFKQIFEGRYLPDETTYEASLDEAITSWKNGEGNRRLRNRSVDIGREIGRSLILINNPTLNSWLTQTRDQIYKQVKEEILSISKSRKFSEVADGPVKRFRNLFLGNMCLVEGREVCAAMGAMEYQLDRWEQIGGEKPPALNQAVIDLGAAIDAELEIEISKVERLEIK